MRRVAQGDDFAQGHEVEAFFLERRQPFFKRVKRHVFRVADGDGGAGMPGDAFEVLQGFIDRSGAFLGQRPRGKNARRQRRFPRCR